MRVTRFLRSHPKALVCLALAVVTIAVYVQVASHPFINYDDEDYITHNQHVAPGLTISGIVWAFTSAHSSNWHPLTWLSHMLDCQLYGLNPGGHHFTSLIIHVLSALLLFLLLTGMTNRLWPSAFVAAVFALHPLHVESVAWASERKDVLSGLFWMLTMLAYVWYAKGPNAITLTPTLSRQGRGGCGGIMRYLLVLLLFALGLMAKPMLVTLPFVLLLMDYWPLNRYKPGSAKGAVARLILEKSPLFALSAASCVITFLVQRASGAVSSAQTVAPGIRVENALLSYVVYIGKMLWPGGLSVIYPHPRAHLPVWQITVAVFLLLLVSVAAVGAFRRRPYVTVGWLWYVGTLIPVIGLVQVGEQAMADRYSYLPMIGLLIVAAWGAPDVAAVVFKRLLPPRALSAVAAVALAVLAALTWLQAGYWRDSRTLFEHALACTSGNYMAENNLASALRDEGDIDQAIEHYRAAVEICAACVPAQGNLANALVTQGLTQEAIDRYKLVLRLEPKDKSAHYNLGLALQRQNMTEEAVRQFREAIGLDRDFAKAHGSLGNALVMLGKADEAILEYREVLRIDPTDKIALHNIEAVRDRKNRKGGSAGSEQTARSHIQAGIALAHEGRSEDAIAEYEQALRIDPRSADAHCNLGVALATQGRLDEAIGHYREAIRINPDHPEAHANLAAALATQGKLDEAISHFRRAEQIKPSYVEVHANLAIALFYKKDYAAAWKEVHLCEKYGGAPNPAFLQDLSQKMPDPGE
ncbi:MAG: tetratricopeptide repeat protein [Armatimonadota bacterium]|nr:tetratricopeptide repeat protein [Armatimonadota bacterium]